MTSENKVYRVAQRKQDDFILSCMIMQCKTMNSRNISRMIRISLTSIAWRNVLQKIIAWSGTCRSTEIVCQQIKLILKVRLSFSFSRTAAVTIWRHECQTDFTTCLSHTWWYVSSRPGPSLSRTIGEKMRVWCYHVRLRNLMHRRRIAIKEQRVFLTDNNNIII